MSFENDSKSFEANVIVNSDGSFNFNISNGYNGKIEAKFIFDNGNGQYTSSYNSVGINLYFSDSSLEFVFVDEGKGTLSKK